MDLSILAGKVKDEIARSTAKGCTYVKKSRYHRCGDSALFVIKKDYTLLGVLDGVSGAAFASLASTTALNTIKKYIETNFSKQNPEELIKNAIYDANATIQQGATTAAIALILSNGSFYFANIGDSHLYLFSHGCIKRLTKEERMTTTLAAYSSARFVVLQCLGGPIYSIDQGKGKLKKGDVLFAFTDGITDNLYIKTKGSKIIDTSGCKDLERLLSNKNKPKEIVQVLSKKIKQRMQQKKDQNLYKVLLPKEDDAAIAIYKY